jgi:hypothetical protein
MATTQNSTGFRTYQATAVAIEAFVRVTLDSNGLISVAGETDLGIGITQEAVAASGYGTVKLWSAPGTFQLQAAAAVTRGAQLYTAAAGEVDDTGTYKIRLLAGEAATAQGDIIECVPIESATADTTAYAAASVGTVAATGNSQGTAAALSKAVTYVTASDGTKAVVLPSAAAGLVYEVYNTVASNNLVVYPGSSDDINDGTTNASVLITGKTAVRFVAVDATTWFTIGVLGS